MLTAKSSTGREESLFSLKQFLKNDSQSNHQFAGARPKVYEPSQAARTPEPDMGGKYPRNPTELPDFVQDHLVIEQCYLGDKGGNSCSSNVEVPYLPDFALNSVEQSRHLKRWRNSQDHPNSLDLPKLDIVEGESADVPESLG